VSRAPAPARVFSVMDTNQPLNREFAVEVTAILAAEREPGRALDEIAALLRDAAKASQADIALAAIATSYSGAALWECVRRAEALEAISSGLRPDKVVSVYETYIPSLAAATATWCMRNELPVIEPPFDAHHSSAPRRSLQQHRTAARVAEIISWGSHSLQRADLIEEMLPLCPRASHLPLLRRYLTLQGPERTLELAERLAPDLLDSALSTIKAEATHAAIGSTQAVPHGG
jgi:hypothetical protein